MGKGVPACQSTCYPPSEFGRKKGGWGFMHHAFIRWPDVAMPCAHARVTFT